MITIEEIYYSENISVRSFNVCYYNDLKDLSAILKHYRENRTFGNLRNCGSKSNEELTALCLKYIDYDSNQIVEPPKPEKQLISTSTNFTRTQREIVNSFIEINSNNLSNRSKNAISSFLDGNLKIRNISERILTNDRFNFQDIKNVGTKTVIELKSFIDSIIDFTTKVADVENENDLVALRNRFFIEKTFSITSIPNEILESQSIFSLVDFLISKNAIFEIKENIIFQKAFKIYDNQLEFTVDEIAEEIKISRERVRQIRKGILENLFTNFQFVKNIEDDLYQKYDIDQNQYLIKIDDDLNNQINEVNNTSFSIEFNTFIIYSYISDKFDLIGGIEDVLQPKYFNSRERHNWDNFYIVNKKISCFFNFNDFANDLDKRLSDRIEESYNFNFKSYLLSFSTSTNLEELNIVSVVAENILNNEFGIYIDTNDDIKFNRNSQKQVYEYAYEALKILGKPSKVNEITRKVEELHPDYETNDAKVRASMKRNNGFIPIGRKSIFGLKEWENELENFKEGTIRQIVAEYLNNNSSPKNYSDITYYVLQFRPKTNEYSIIQNIKLDESKTFIFFKNSFVGLSSKIYDKTFITLTNSDTIEKKSWQERYTDLTEFLALNNRLPFSSSCPENEIKLYRWYKIQVRKTINGEIEDEKNTLINEVIYKFEKGESSRRTSLNNMRRSKKVRSNSKYTFDDLVEFISNKRRMPNSRDPNEASLYQFYYKNKKNLENIDTLSSQESKLIELINKYGSSKQPKYTIDELMEFLKINKRMPDARDPNEASLYQFYYKNKKNLENIDTLSSQESTLIELINKYGSSKHPKYTIDELMEFLKINKRMPDARDPNEASLYQFYYKNKKNLENIDTLSSQESKLIELINKYGSSKQPKYTIDELMEFLKINKRMPDARDPNEASLYQFYYKNKKNLENIDTLSNQESTLIELINKYGSSKHPKYTIDELMEF
ncbi:MAG: hypothetical protein IPH57_04220 [Saprospiraceae bacterium]|nr:hypothetical protein [Saprospiraceae bacterium]